MKARPPGIPTVPENDLFRKFQSAFERVTGLKVELMAPGEYRIPEGAPDFCRRMGLTRPSCNVCRDAHLLLQESSRGGTQTRECFAGMTSTSVPVRVRGRTVAYLHVGHVFLGKVAKANWGKLKKFLVKQNLEPEACARDLSAAGRTEPAHYESAVRLLEIFALQLSDSLPSGGVSASYPAVDKILQMIREDLEGDWTLAKAAGKAKMNPSYFSDTFRKSTGETFTACLARLRTERACRLLESTRLGIGEVAFAAGFRSISQFNRVFKKHKAVSPGQFRLSQSLAEQ